MYLKEYLFSSKGFITDHNCIICSEKESHLCKLTINEKNCTPDSEKNGYDLDSLNVEYFHKVNRILPGS